MRSRSVLDEDVFVCGWQGGGLHLALSDLSRLRRVGGGFRGGFASWRVMGR